MKYMNDYDLHRALRVNEDKPNRLSLAQTVNNLRLWTDDNSDGWAYWKQPLQAAKRAMEEIEGDGTNRADDRPDTTDAQRTAALRPIKAFLTRQGVAHDEIIVDPQ